jgi:hypothetical protein
MSVRRLTDREMQELRLFIVLSAADRKFTIETATRRSLLDLGVLGRYGRTGTFYVTELGHQIARGVWSR